MLQQGAQVASGFHDLRRQPVHFDIAPIADHQPAIRAEHDQALRHVVDGGVEAQILLLQFGLARAQFGGALVDLLLEPAIELVDLLDHQRDGVLGAAPLALGLLIGGDHQRAELVEVDLARRAGRFRQLLREQLLHGRLHYRPTASLSAVTVMVWLCSSQQPEAACGEISP